MLEVVTATQSECQSIVPHLLLVSNTYWVRCDNANTGARVANTQVVLQIVTAPVSFFEVGGVIPELIHRFKAAYASLRKGVSVC